MKIGTLLSCVKRSYRPIGHKMANNVMKKEYARERSSQAFKLQPHLGSQLRMQVGVATHTGWGTSARCILDFAVLVNFKTLAELTIHS